MAGILVAATATLALTSATANAAELGSGFDAGDEGWRVFANSVNFSNLETPEWVADGGNPGGYIRVTDASQGSYWEAQAPQGWRGDKSANYGGSITFDARHSDPDTGPIVAVQSYDHGYLFYAHSRIPTGWRNYSTPLTETDPCWSFIDPATGPGPVEPRAPTKTEFQAVLADVDNIRVGAEMGFVAGDVGELDNIRLSETPSSTSVGCGPPPDSDGDITPDEFDACPTQPGPPNLGGCPPAATPPTVPPSIADPACTKAQEKFEKAKEKLADAEGKRAKAKARAKLKKAKEKMKEACA